MSIGLLVDGEPAFGAIYLPVVEDLYTAEPGAACLNGRRMEPPGGEPLDEHSYVMVPESFHNNYAYEWAGDLMSLGAVATHCCYVARGSAVASLSRPCIWDLAAGVAIMQQTGVQTRYLDGSQVDWTALFGASRLPQPALAARPDHWDQISRSLWVRASRQNAAPLP